MSVSVQYSGGLSVTETVDQNAAGLATSTPGNTLLYNLYNKNVTLNAGTTPAATKHANFVATLSSGTLTIDLTSLTGTNAATINGTGLAVQAIKIQAPTGNANNITVAPGGSNSYNLFGASFLITAFPGADYVFFLNGKAPTIGSGAKTLLLTGTGAQTLNMEIVMG